MEAIRHGMRFSEADDLTNFLILHVGIAMALKASEGI
jgi:hypothetical protein